MTHIIHKNVRALVGTAAAALIAAGMLSGCSDGKQSGPASAAPTASEMPTASEAPLDEDTVSSVTVYPDGPSGDPGSTKTFRVTRDGTVEGDCTFDGEGSLSDTTQELFFTIDDNGVCTVSLP